MSRLAGALEGLAFCLRRKKDPGAQAELTRLREQVQSLTEECAALRRKNADMAQVLTFIREVVYSTSVS